MECQEQDQVHLNSMLPIFIKRKGGTVMIYDNLNYYKHKTYKNGNQFWVCSESKKKKGIKCLGSVTLQAGEIVNTKHHRTKDGHDCCLPDVAKTEVTLAIEKAKTEAMTSNEPLSKVYKKAVDPLYRKGINLVTTIPSYSSKKNVMIKKRNEGFQSSKTVFKNIKDVKVPGKFSTLLIADYTSDIENTRILLFCSEKAQEKMKFLQEYFIDATFYTAPKPFYQMVVIRGDDGTTSRYTKTVPLIYALMSSKTEKAYRILFDLITVGIPNWKPIKIHADFELAITNALKTFFPEVIVKRCYFHFTQNLWKKSKQLGIKRKIYVRIVGLCTCLPLLPVDRISIGWDYINTESENLQTGKLKEFLKYVQKYYINKNIDEWCVYNEIHRTNNIAESWNSMFNKQFKKPYVTLNKLLTVISEKENTGSLVTPKRRKEYYERNELILNAQMELVNNEISIGHFMDKLR